MPDLITPKDAADFLLVESRERGELLTNLKLQKLLYYAQAWHLALKGAPLFQEDFKAWVHGPVLTSQYARFRDFQWRPIELDGDRPVVEAELRRHLIEIIDEFGVESAVGLELMTHREKPWLEARGDLAQDQPSNAKISKDTMRTFYRALADA
jgi:uncharacterized phage-associated protein